MTPLNILYAVKRSIEETRWDERLLDTLKKLELWVIWPLIVFTIVYFGFICAAVLWRMS